MLHATLLDQVATCRAGLAKRTQHVVWNNVARCCTNMLHPFGQGLTLSLSRVINFKFPLQPHQKDYITQYEELGFSQLNQMKDDYTINSYYFSCTFLLKRLGECTFWPYLPKLPLSQHTIHRNTRRHNPKRASSSSEVTSRSVRSVVWKSQKRASLL